MEHLENREQKTSLPGHKVSMNDKIIMFWWLTLKLRSNKEEETSNSGQGKMQWWDELATVSIVDTMEANISASSDATSADDV